uniref:NADH dehydrogenase subunit 6 n=1 Tax=Nigidius miwai TaxID=618256 RepID=UPI0020291C8A|nr:NADH dehydrogenase subunit 6 [Nigidius miwai]UPO69316.1 NADH dehydrogenase subunit 6 [Nigidius miwai]
MLTILALSITMSFLIISTNHPLTLGMSLLIQTLMIALMSSLLSSSSWFSYIMFLIMIGGMLVLFMYMTSVASNEKFKFSTKILSLISISFILILTTKFMDSWLIKTPTNYLSMENNPLFILLNKFLNLPLISISSLIIIFLFLTLVAVIKITNIKHGPLRTLN